MRQQYPEIRKFHDQSLKIKVIPALQKPPNLSARSLGSLAYIFHLVCEPSPVLNCEEIVEDLRLAASVVVSSCSILMMPARITSYPDGIRSDQLQRIPSRSVQQDIVQKIASSS
jgi:hypothetical protein